MKIFFLFALSFIGLSYPVFSQQPAATDTLKLVQILNADRYGFKKLDSVNEHQTMAGNVRLKQENTLFYADSAIFNKHTRYVEAFGNIHINDNDSVHTYSQYLLYHVDTKIAILKKKVRLTDNQSNLFTEELEYDLNQKVGIYRNGGRVENKSSILTSKEATYYADLKDVYFKKDVVLKDPQYNLRSDSLLYNTETEVATFISRTVIEDSARKIITRDGFYDLKNKNAFFGQRPTIQDGAVTIIANEVETDDVTGISKLRGNAVFKDSAQGIAVLANAMESNKEAGTLLATVNPLMILKQENDSIFVRADTLYSGRLTDLYKKDSLHTDSLATRDTMRNALALSSSSDKDSANRYFQAYRNVRIFSDSLQAVSDSLFYSGKDSIFQLFQNPVVWSGDNQVTGDTIYLYTKNKKADRLFVFENGLLVNKTGPELYNQIRGNRLNGYFTDGNIDYLRARGNAESIYYVKDDDSALIGVNKATGDVIDLRFRDKALHKVVFINEVQGTMYPFSQMSDTDKILRNFKWHEARRPRSKFELFEN